jgi:hypothetical protein
MAGKARIQVIWLQVEGATGFAQASAADSMAPNKANCPRFWPTNGGRAENRANSPDLLGGGTMR